MTSFVRYILQISSFALFAAMLGFFSTSPAFQYAPAEMAIIKLAFSHAAERVVPCVQLTPEEVAALAPNMRRTESCERKRLPLTVELAIDDKVLLARQAPPSGLWGDGPASIYEKMTLPPGRYKVDLRLRDSARESGWDYERSADIELAAGRYLTITFRSKNGGFLVR
ncbi:MAG: hypothetical protein ACR2QS_13355 [Woeseiaceae bacterium]